MAIDSKASASFCFIPAYGTAVLSVSISQFTFAASPKLRQDGNFNDLDFDIHDLSITIPKDVVHFEKLSLGLVPGFIMTPIVNFIFDFQVINDQFKKLEGVISETAKSAINEVKKQIPNHIDIPYSPFAFSLSFPDVPSIGIEKSYLPVDGTIYLQKQGYNPQQRTVPATPKEDLTNSNNVQVFLNEYVINTLFQTLKDS